MRPRTGTQASVSLYFLNIWFRLGISYHLHRYDSQREDIGGKVA